MIYSCWLLVVGCWLLVVGCWLLVENRILNWNLKLMFWI
ncbi:Potassium uptake protein TrkH [Winogradskyella psychrotolerans RS-3]|uniref:Potassium uptake protein TrkH n=1 Tax=Winogradskyella psychrotolerans RS-3 TaxID=641526 RepID=S7VV09_9FLAO|nr:Potassium uptake protein TrkH [Winogradskyella psychrotolerans RS-3]